MMTPEKPGTVDIKWMSTQVTRLLPEEYMLVEFKE